MQFRNLKRLWNRLRGIKENFPVKDNILFIHHEPSIFNIGDYLCSPRHYFKFINPIHGLAIVGGGTFVDFANKRLKRNKIDLKKTIIWAIGHTSRTPYKTLTKIESLPFLHWGIRDKERVSEDHFLPCVSCLHPMLDYPTIATQTLLFLNANSKISPLEFREQYKTLAVENNWILLYNNCSEQEMANALQNCDYIITNSYHGAYWGLLSGKKVSLLGYSSKFVNLLNLFDFDASKLIFTEKGSGLALLKGLQSCITNPNIVYLKDYKTILNVFRLKNLNFINLMVQKKIIEDFQLLNEVIEIKKH